MIREVTEKEVLIALSDKNSVVVDARSSNAYIGWRLDGEEREGHIKGAVDFSADWLRYDGKVLTKVKHKEQAYEEQLKNKLTWRKLLPEKSVIVYDQTGKDAPIVVEYFEKLGITNVSYFPLSSWTGEMEKYPNYSNMVPISWVNELVSGKKPEHYLGNGYRIFEVTWGRTKPEFLEGHIPSTIRLDSEEYEVGPEWIRVSDEELEKFACKYGISVNTTVVLYARKMLDLGAIAKLAVILKYMGVKQVCIMNGFYDSYVKAGYELESTVNEPVSCESFGGVIPYDTSFLVDLPEAREIVSDSSKGQIIDIREWKEYVGRESGYDYVPNSGRIPTSIWCSNFTFYTNPDYTMGNAQEMYDFWVKSGVDTSKKMAFFCGSASWGAAIIEFFAYTAGIENVTIYEGGWGQWQHYPENPILTGELEVKQK